MLLQLWSWLQRGLSSSRNCSTTVPGAQSPLGLTWAPLQGLLGWALSSLLFLMAPTPFLSLSGVCLCSFNKSTTWNTEDNRSWSQGSYSRWVSQSQREAIDHKQQGGKWSEESEDSGWRRGLIPGRKSRGDKEPLWPEQTRMAGG